MNTIQYRLDTAITELEVVADSMARILQDTDGDDLVAKRLLIIDLCRAVDALGDQVQDIEESLE